MNKETYLKAVRYAKGWKVKRFGSQWMVVAPHFAEANEITVWNMQKEMRAALAAQLVDQIDAMYPKYRLSIGRRGTHVVTPEDDYSVASCEDKGRTDNTIEACVQLLDKVKADG